MAVWSTLRALLTRVPPKNALNAVVKRGMSGDHHQFNIQPTRWQWTKFKDLFHFYVLLGVIPCTAIVAYTNVFIGPATLTEIPEDYEPKYWEYQRHPISRFLARYVLSNPQQEHEKFLHLVFEEEEKKRIRKLHAEVNDKMRERLDYQAYYYRPVTAKYHRAVKDNADYLDTVIGD